MSIDFFKKNYEKELIEIAKEYSIDYFILFGSHAIDKDKKNSDFDLAYFKKKELTSNREFELYEDLQSIFKDRKFDLVKINLKISEVLKYEIFKKGYCFYAKDSDLYVRHKENSYFSYIDSFVLLEPTKIKYLEAN